MVMAEPIDPYPGNASPYDSNGAGHMAMDGRSMAGSSRAQGEVQPSTPTNVVQ